MPGLAGLPRIDKGKALQHMAGGTRAAEGLIYGGAGTPEHHLIPVNGGPFISRNPLACDMAGKQQTHGGRSRGPEGWGWNSAVAGHVSVSFTQ